MKNRKEIKRVGPLLLGASFFLLAGCGEKNEKNIHQSMGSVQEGQDAESRYLEGNYRVRFIALNPELAENASAELVGEIKGDQVDVTIRGMNMAEGVTHPQFLYEAERCPTMDDDTNEDGVLDQVEVLETTEGILIPFDDDLSEQVSSASVFPMSSGEGSYVYEEEASLSAILTDLKASDENPNDRYIKLSENEDLKLEGKVVVIHGVSANATLPDTVASEGELAIHETVPVACGVVEKVDGDDDGDNDGGETPVPTPDPTEDGSQDEGPHGKGQVKGEYSSGKGKGATYDSDQYTYQE